MALWLTALKIVPWVDVISAAPKVADGAKKLWTAVAQKSPPEPPADPIAPPPMSAAEQAMADIQVRLHAVEASASELHDQMLASSELIKALSEQNTQLIRRVEVNRVRVLWLAAAVLVLAVVAIAACVRLF
jgi:hypothetical protein